MKSQLSKIVQDWIAKADDDLAFAKAGFRDGFYNQVCMLCQQAVEKYLKAYLVQAKGEIRKKERVHDLPKLADWCKDFGLNLQDYYVQLRTLSEFYLPVRYPDAAFGVFSMMDAEQAIKMAEEIIGEIKKKLNSGY